MTGGKFRGFFFPEKTSWIFPISEGTRISDKKTGFSDEAGKLSGFKQYAGAMRKCVKKKAAERKTERKRAKGRELLFFCAINK